MYVHYNLQYKHSQNDWIRSAALKFVFDRVSLAAVNTERSNVSSTKIIIHYSLLIICETSYKTEPC